MFWSGGFFGFLCWSINDYCRYLFVAAFADTFSGVEPADVTKAQFWMNI